MGVDMATRKQLIAHQMNVRDICTAIGADSLAYLSLEGMMACIEQTPGLEERHCNACFSGNYPIPIPGWLFEEERDKKLFEATWGE
jgi:amidophosphoribosyltransferase